MGGYRDGIYGCQLITTSERGTLFSSLDIRESPVLAWYEDDDPRESLRLACEDVAKRRAEGEDVRVVERTTYGPMHPAESAWFDVHRFMEAVAA